MLQAKNEVKTGHLTRFLRMNMELLDELYAVDDASDDGTLDALIDAGAKVLQKSFDSFKRELIIKNELINLIREYEAADTWVLRLDADEVLFCSRSELEAVIEDAENSGFDSIAMRHLNLWRSEHMARLDDGFDSFNPVRLWHMTSEAKFPSREGLHITSDPIGIKKTKYLSKYPVVHYGFSSSKLILEKATSYWSLGQRGYALNRLLLDSNSHQEPLSSFESSLGSRYNSPKASAESQPEKGGLPLLFNKKLPGPEDSPVVTIVCLIFAGLDWLEFQYSELLALSREFRRGYVEILFIANDPTPEVESFLAANKVPHKIFRGSKSSEEWYINSVYRAYNYGVSQAKAPTVLLTNSDMAYSSGFLSNMLEHFDPTKLNTARLVESGRLPSGPLGIEKDFGSSPRNFRRQSFTRYAEKIKTNQIMPGGLFMPLMMDRSLFESLGGFPEGNIKSNQLERYLSGDAYEIAKLGDSLFSGDEAFFRLAESWGHEHRTIGNSVSYHFQEGELQSSRRNRARRKIPASGIAIVNDSVSGISGEPVFWGALNSWLLDEGLSAQIVESGRADSRFKDFFSPFRLWMLAHGRFRDRGVPRVAFQNATYQLPAPLARRRVLLLQDKPRSNRLVFLQKICELASSLVITNDLSMFEERSGKKMRFLHLPISDFWWQEFAGRESINLDALERVLFVGEMNETKGWPRILKLIEADPRISWKLVLKGNPSEIKRFRELAPSNVKVYSKLGQDQMRDLYRWTDVLISGSPHETQHLVSLEAISQNKPVLITPTGLLGSYGTGVHDFGLVTDNLSLAELYSLTGRSFAPRSFLEKSFANNERLKQLWLLEFEDQLEQSFLSTRTRFFSEFYGRVRSAILDIYRQLKKRIIAKLQRVIH